MVKRSFWIWVAISALFLFTSCSTTAGYEVDLDKEFTLSAGQNATVKGENFSLKFIEVLSDSRCPRGVTCIWAGEVKFLVEMTESESTHSEELIQSGSSSPAKTSFKDYELAFDVQPYPEAGKEITEEDYRLVLVVSKN
jgi:hypothetical protein